MIFVFIFKYLHSKSNNEEQNVDLKNQKKKLNKKDLKNKKKEFLFLLNNKILQNLNVISMILIYYKME